MNLRHVLTTTALAAGGALLLSPAGLLAQTQQTQQPNAQTQHSQTKQMQNQQMRQQEMQNHQNGQHGQMHSGSMNGRAMHANKWFVKKANERNNTEIQLAHLALQKSQNQQVKQYAQKLIKDHTTLNQQLQPVEQQLGVQQTNAIPSSARKLKKKLDGLSGKQFDDAYIKAMVKGHEKALKTTQKTIKKTKDSELKQTAENADQVMQGHLKEAEHLAQTLNVHTGGNSMHGE